MGIGRLSSNWKVNGTSIYEPSSGLKILHTSISSADSGRTEDGVMHNTWVRQNIVKIDFVWKALTGNELETLVNLMQGKEFTLTYYEYGKTHTAEVYVAEITYEYSFDGGYGSEGGVFMNVACSAVEK